ncbi:MAG: DUF3067 family protein [Cyanobacteriota bacterium]|nr:DUF3067 family protein [Cyanobacteriota bacterium]
MQGHDLRQLLIDKWGKSYDVQLRRVGERISLLVMWKYLEQSSFPVSEAEYLERLGSVLSCLQAWGAWESVQQEILSTRQSPRLGKAVSIPIDLAHLGERASEWLI